MESLSFAQCYLESLKICNNNNKKKKKKKRKWKQSFSKINLQIESSRKNDAG